MKLVKYVLLLFLDKIVVNTIDEPVIDKKQSIIKLKKGLAPKSLKEGDTIYDVANDILGKYCAIL